MQLEKVQYSQIIFIRNTKTQRDPKQHYLHHKKLSTLSKLPLISNDKNCRKNSPTAHKSQIPQTNVIIKLSSETARPKPIPSGGINNSASSSLPDSSHNHNHYFNSGRRLLLTITSECSPTASFREELERTEGWRVCYENWFL